MRAALLALVACTGGDAIQRIPKPCAPLPPDGTGDATFYAADGTGHCSFEASPNDLLVAAMNSEDYSKAAWCGACLEVTGPTSSVVVRVVDSCPGCKKGDLDLSPQAFEKLAPRDKGRLKVTWRVVECPVNGPLGYHFKEKSNPFWTGIQIRGHRYPIAKLEVWDATGTLREVPRTIYNYFVAQKLGPGPYALRVTDTRGHTRLDPFVPLAPEKTITGAGQFPTCTKK